MLRVDAAKPCCAALFGVSALLAVISDGSRGAGTAPTSSLCVVF